MSLANSYDGLDTGSICTYVRFGYFARKRTAMRFNYFFGEIQVKAQLFVHRTKGKLESKAILIGVTKEHLRKHAVCEKYSQNSKEVRASSH